jgi:hypothetical protein
LKISNVEITRPRHAYIDPERQLICADFHSSEMPGLMPVAPLGLSAAIAGGVGI